MRTKLSLSARLRLIYAAVLVLLTLAVTASMTSASLAQPVRSEPSDNTGCGLQWSIVPSPNGGSSYNRLADVVALSPNDAWAVGSYEESGQSRALAMHWDGAQWQVVPSPNPGYYRIELSDVAAVAANDVWAVGWYKESAQAQTQTLTMHWDGSTWSVVPSPNIGSNTNTLSEVAVLNGNDVWAVGLYLLGPDVNRPFAIRWNGIQWSGSLLPYAPCIDPCVHSLGGISAQATDDIWVVGSYFDGFQARTFTEHWNGSQWSIIASPNPGPMYRALYGVTAIAPDDVWAVGYYYPGTGGPSANLILHWDGSAWTQVAAPNAGTSSNNLWDVDAIAANDVWAIGTYLNAGTEQTLSLHWNGSQWSVVPTPNSGAGVNRLLGIAALSGGDVWAVGYTSTQTLVERYANQCVTATPSPTPQSPTASITAIPTSTHTTGTTATATATPSTSPTPCGIGTWRVIDSPNGERVGTILLGVTSLGPNDVWAVGYSGDYPSSNHIVHWDGTAWNIVPSPNPSTGQNQLRAIAVVDEQKIWAVGGSGTAGYMSSVLHWDGTQWIVQSTPNVGLLYGIAAFGSADIWAVGQDGIIHWDGNIWSISPTPNAYFRAISGTASDDIWAVGQQEAIHWDGTAWTASPDLCSICDMNGIAAIAPDDAWAVGYNFYICGVGCNFSRARIEHWDGTSWSVVESNLSDDIRLYGVSSAGQNDVWAVGQRNQYGTPNESVILHFDGATWGLYTNPNPGSVANGLYSVSATATDDVWAVGLHRNDPAYPYHNLTLVERYTNSFSDVPLGSPFYPYIQCLACRNIISGYSDGSFRPGNEITRGQIAKIVSNAAGFEEDPGDQIYEDTPPTQPFYVWVNRLSRRGYMGGYPCGAIPEEPCNLPYNRPYFRPGANATRGQLAKIVSNTAGIIGDPSGQFYADVQGDNPFYLWIMRLTNLGVMSGYACGGQGEPCDNQNRPYFRPYANVTRGQASKIVANTFFPNCQPAIEP